MMYLMASKSTSSTESASGIPNCNAAECNPDATPSEVCFSAQIRSFRTSGRSRHKCPSARSRHTK